MNISFVIFYGFILLLRFLFVVFKILVVMLFLKREVIWFFKGVCLKDVIVEVFVVCFVVLLFSVVEIIVWFVCGVMIFVFVKVDIVFDFVYG